jgi:hypothetical protein
LAQGLETHKEESMAIKLPRDSEGTVLACERAAAVCGEADSNCKAAPNLVKKKELKCSHIYKYFTVLERKYGGTIGNIRDRLGKDRACGREKSTIWGARKLSIDPMYYFTQVTSPVWA